MQQVNPEHLFALALGAPPVSASPDLRRIMALPSRAYSPQALAQLQDAWTAHLKTPHGTERLFPAQAQAIAECRACGGTLSPIRVGGGKTLVSFLCFTVLQAKRPLLVVPAKLVAKTRKDLQEASRHWQVPFNMHVMSYEMLGREAASSELDTRNPDVICLDEAHRAKNHAAACTRRLKRFYRAHPESKWVIVSGTIVKDGIKDFAHLGQWALGASNPCPNDVQTALDWSSALDDKIRPGTRKGLGALAEAFAPGREPTIEAVREGFFRRFTSTLGVVSTAGDTVDCRLRIETVPCELGEGAQAQFERLREWENPDGIAIADPMQAWALAGQLAMGFHYYLDPRPSDAWFAKRAAWAAFARKHISASRSLDSEKQVRTKVLESRDCLGLTLLRAWEEESAKYTGVQKHRWHDTGMLDAACAWAARNPRSLIWSWHNAFGRALAARAKLPYAGAKGEVSPGKLVDTLDGDCSVVLSIAANGEGRNLQAWSNNLVCAPPTTGLLWEQLLGRTHRYGQKDPQGVRATIMVACREHARAVGRAHSGSRMTSQLIGASQKLLLADWTCASSYGDPDSPAFSPMSGGRTDLWDEYEIT